MSAPVCFTLSGNVRMGLPGPPKGDQEYARAVRRAQDLVASGEGAQARMLVNNAANRAPGSVRPNANAVGLALKSLEKERVKKKLEVQMPRGSYRLVLVANEDKKDRTRVKAQYFPIYGEISFFPESEDALSGSITNTARLPVLGGVQFTGPFRWVPRSRRIEFDFLRVAVRLFGLPAWSFDIKKDDNSLESNGANEASKGRGKPFFSFFFVEDDLLAGRGRSGGLALWKLESLTVPPSL